MLKLSKNYVKLLDSAQQKARTVTEYTIQRRGNRPHANLSKDKITGTNTFNSTNIYLEK